MYPELMGDSLVPVIHRDPHMLRRTEGIILDLLSDYRQRIYDEILKGTSRHRSR